MQTTTATEEAAQTETIIGGRITTAALKEIANGDRVATSEEGFALALEVTNRRKHEVAALELLDECCSMLSLELQDATDERCADSCALSAKVDTFLDLSNYSDLSRQSTVNS